MAWNSEAEEAFHKLKAAFTTARVLKHPNPETKVDASDTGVGAVLSQRLGKKKRKMRPIAYFSKKLTPAEQNYDVGNRELLAVKLALEEWRHRLEGTSQPFLVLTDPKNLEYLLKAKRINPDKHVRLFFLPVQLHYILSTRLQEW